MILIYIYQFESHPSGETKKCKTRKYLFVPKNNMAKKLTSLFLDIFISLLLVGFSFFASYVFLLWSGYPVGGDAAQHLSRLVYVLTFPTSFNWFHVWAGGMPQFLWYPSLPYLLLTALIKITSLAPELALSFSAVAAAGLSGVALYFLVLSVTKSRLAGFMSGVIFLASPPTYILNRASVYARQLALPLLLFTFLFFVRFWKSYQEGVFSKRDFVLCVLFMGTTFVYHLAMGATVLGFIVITVIFTSKSIKKSINGFVKVVVPALLLSSFFWLPLFFFPMSGFVAGEDVLSWPMVSAPLGNLLFFFDKEYLWFFNPKFSILPFFLFGGLLVFGALAFLKRKKLSLGFFDKRFFLVTLTLSFLCTLYAQFTFSFLGSFYSNIWPAAWFLLFSTMFISTGIGILFSRSITSILGRLLVVLVLVLTCLGWMQTQFPVDFLPKNPYLRALSYNSSYKRIDPDVGGDFFISVAKSLFPDAKESNFRFGTANLNYMARWFNIAYPWIPQTREYNYIAVVDPDSYFHLIQAVWFTENNYEETNFLLDWWAVKKFISGTEGDPNDLLEKFVGKESIYQPLGEFSKKGFNINYKAYEYQNASPILSATNTPTLLVIGKKKVSLTTLFRSFSYGNIGSKIIIPIEGSEFIDDYDVNELKKFSIVFLYDYNYHDFSKVNNLLLQYVEDGGHLIIEENKEASNEPFSISPVERVVREERVSDWQFDFQDKDVVAFEPAVYDDGPWAVMIGEKLKEGSQVLLTSSGKPVLVAKDLGKGRVVWSGLNLPFHIIYNHSKAESQFLFSLLGVQEVDEISSKVEFINPQRREIEAGNARGVLFKEFYFPKWHAYAGGKEIEIYKAGPGFMYAFLPDSQDKLTFVFKYSLIERLGFLISGVSLVVIIFYSFEGVLFPPLVSSLAGKLGISVKKMKKRASSWWEKDEE